MSDAPENPTGPNPTTVPTCYRHPGRETYIRCTRCERHICTDCMIPAAVGFHCPECIREGATSVRVAQTVTGGTVQADPALITKALVVVNVLVFIAALAGDRVVARLALVSSGLIGGVDPIGVAEGEWYRLVTAAFVHVNWWHIAMNMYALWLIGPPVEAMEGRWRFLALYLVSGVAGSALSLAYLGPLRYSLGASGAVFGLLGATLVLGRRFNRDTSVAATIIVLSTVLALAIPGLHVDWRAHLGGALAGAAIAAGYAYAPKKWRALLSLGVVAVVLAVALLGVALTVA